MTSTAYSTQSKFLRIDGINIHYLSTGSGEPVVLLHGLPTSSFLWRKVIKFLAGRYKAIAPDLPGYGKSDKPINAIYDLEFFYRVLDSLIDTLDIRQINLVVHDLGGPIGLLWAVRNPYKLKRLVILNTTVHSKIAAWIKLLMLPAHIPVLGNLLFASPMSIGAMMKWGVINKKIMTQDIILNYQEPYKTPETRKAFLDTLKALRPKDLKEIQQKLPTLNVPISIIFAEKDISTAAGMRRLKHDLPHASFTSIPNCGHFLQEDQPEKLSKLLLEFLSNDV